MTTNKEMENSQELIMKVNDVAEYLRLSKAKVYRMANAGQLPALRLGKTWRFKKEILDDWIRQKSTGGEMTNAARYKNKETVN